MTAGLLLLAAATLSPCLEVFNKAEKNFKDMYKSTAVVTKEFAMTEVGPVSSIKAFNGGTFVAALVFAPYGSVSANELPSHLVVVNKGSCIDGTKKYTQWLILPSVLKEKK
tara:strand:+ start:1483 stop:1815 length:333 start_codon:yes stop_codon:yes gene_type:complete